MKRTFLLLTVMIALVLMFSGCAKYPQEELDAAQQAVDEAKQAGAPTNCPDKYAAAEAKLTEAKQAADVDKDYEKAKVLAKDTIILANVAKGCPTPTPPPTPPPATPAPPDKLQLPAVHFDFDRYNIRKTDLAKLNKSAMIIKEGNKSMIVTGHCDERGTSEYNRALGERRAKSVRNYLIAQGVPAASLLALSKGEDMPVDPGHNEAAWAKNRRAEFLDKTGK